jgi:hypothetical protein
MFASLSTNMKSTNDIRLRLIVIVVMLDTSVDLVEVQLYSIICFDVKVFNETSKQCDLHQSRQ